MSDIEQVGGLTSSPNQELVLPGAIRRNLQAYEVDQDEDEGQGEEQSYVLM